MKSTLNKAVLILTVSIFVLFSTFIAANAAAARFKDVKAMSWYNAYVLKLVELKITSGYSDGTYKPDNQVTRAEFVTFLCKAAGHKPAQGASFSDTEKHWASGYITIALNNGILELPADKKFRPDAAITRLEAVEMLCKALSITKDSTTKNPYTDVKTSDTGYTNAAYTNYLMQGTVDKNGRYFNPSGKLTRAEAAAIVVNAYDYHSDKIAYLNKKAAAEKEKVEKEKAEQDRYAAWNQLVKGMPSELLANTKWLEKKSVYESYKSLRNQEFDFLKNWGAHCNMTPEQFEKEMVRVGTGYGDMWANANYKNNNEFKNKLNSYWAKYGVITTIYQSNLDYVKNNTIVSEGKFIANEGTLIYSDGLGNPALMGTMKYRYSSQTSIKLLNSEIVSSTGKASKVGVWYEQDYIITFSPERDGLKVNSCRSISEIRISN